MSILNKEATTIVAFESAIDYLTSKLKKTIAIGTTAPPPPKPPQFDKKSTKAVKNTPIHSVAYIGKVRLWTQMPVVDDELLLDWDPD